MGSLVTHIGSGVSYEVSSALDIMISLTSNNSEELIPISSHITGKVLSYASSWSLLCPLYYSSSSDIQFTELLHIEEKTYFPLYLVLFIFLIDISTFSIQEYWITWRVLAKIIFGRFVIHCSFLFYSVPS